VNKWFKLYSEARTDFKLQKLNDSQFRVWFNLLCFASEHNGTADYQDKEFLAMEVSRDNISLLEETVILLVKYRIVKVENNVIIFLNWLKRQARKPSDDPDEVGRRVTRFREKKRDVTPSDDIVTPCNALQNLCNATREEKKREDQKREEREEKNNCSPCGETVIGKTPEENLSLHSLSDWFCKNTPFANMTINAVNALLQKYPNQKQVTKEALKASAKFNEKHKKPPDPAEWFIEKWMSRLTPEKSEAYLGREFPAVRPDLINKERRSA